MAQIGLSVRPHTVDQTPVLEWQVDGFTEVSISPHGFDFPKRTVSSKGQIALLRAALEVYDRAVEIHWAINEFFMKNAMGTTNKHLSVIANESNPTN